jgi:hypothetical protein
MTQLEHAEALANAVHSLRLGGASGSALPMATDSQLMQVRVNASTTVAAVRAHAGAAVITKQLDTLTGSLLMAQAVGALSNHELEAYLSLIDAMRLPDGDHS